MKLIEWKPEMENKILAELKDVYRDGFPEDSRQDAEEFFAGVKFPENAVYLTENGRIISAGYILEKPAVLGGKKTKLQFLSALSTRKEYRGRGKIKAVISEIFSRLIARGEYFCALYPFNHEYYKRYGFCNISFCGEKKNGAAPLDLSGFDNYLLSPRKEFLTRYDFSGQSMPYVQGRIINAQKALESAPYMPNLNKTTVLQIIDPIIAENNITLKISDANGKARVARTDSAAPDQTLSIDSLCGLVLLGDGKLIKKQRNFFPDQY